MWLLNGQGKQKSPQARTIALRTLSKDLIYLIISLLFLVKATGLKFIAISFNTN